MGEFFAARLRWSALASRDVILLGLVSTMVGLAWLLLGFWSVSPNGRYRHPDLGLDWLGQGLPGGEVLLPLVLQAGLWLGLDHYTFHLDWPGLAFGGLDKFRGKYRIIPSP